MPAIGDDFHSLLSPSRAPRFLRCPGSVALEEFIPNSSSTYADEGTAMHTLFAMVFGADQIVAGVTVKEAHTLDFLGEEIFVKDNPKPYVVTTDFAEPVQDFIDQVRARMEPGDVLLVEQRVHYGHLVGVPEQSGSADVQIVHVSRKELEVIDAKFGMGVPVRAEGNEQARLYGIGSLDQLDLIYDLELVRNVIIQPRIPDGTSEELLTVDELTAWVQDVAKPGFIAAHEIYERVHGPETQAEHDAYYSRDPVQPGELNPGDKQCRFCRASATCPAKAQKAVNDVAGDFVDLDAPSISKQLTAAVGDVHGLSNEELAKRLRAVPFVQGWCKDILALADTRLLAGETIDGFKVVQGKQGDRKWTDEEAARKYIARKLGTAESTEAKVISPTVAEKKFKAAKDTKSFEYLTKNLIARTEGGPAVVPDSDPRPALTIQPVIEAFGEVVEEVEDLSDLA